jgi:hypothetical protein
VQESEEQPVGVQCAGGAEPGADEQFEEVFQGPQGSWRPLPEGAGEWPGDQQRYRVGVSERQAPEGGGEAAQFLPPVSGSGIDGEVGENQGDNAVQQHVFAGNVPVQRRNGGNLPLTVEAWTLTAGSGDTRLPDRRRPGRRPPAALLLARRVHRDTALQLNDFAAAPSSCSAGAARGNPTASCAANFLRPTGWPSSRAVEKLWGFCGDLGPRGRFLRHRDSLSSRVVAGERADDVSSEWLPR